MIKNLEINLKSFKHHLIDVRVDAKLFCH